MASAICSIRYIDDEKEEIWPSTCSSTSGSYLYNVQIAVAVNYLHESWVMHCDLKVSNVLLSIVEDQNVYFSLSSVQCSSKYCGGSECVLFLVICAMFF
jgi:serine/threonine protein kinase